MDMKKTSKRQLLGRINMGYMDKNRIPHATSYFVVPPEVAKIYGSKPKHLNILLPKKDSSFPALQIKRGVVNIDKTYFCVLNLAKKFALRTTSNGNTRKIPCQWYNCEYWSRCRQVITFDFVLPKVNKHGLYRIATGSVDSMSNLQETIRAVANSHRIPLILKIVPKKVNVINKDLGSISKKTKYFLELHRSK